MQLYLKAINRYLFLHILLSIFLHIMLKKYANSETINKNWQFYCEKCDYGCNKSFLFNQHLKTKKHEKQKCSKMLIKNMPEHKCSCGRIYKHVQSYNRHIKNCNHYIASNIDKEKNELIKLFNRISTKDWKLHFIQNKVIILNKT